MGVRARTATVVGADTRGEGAPRSRHPGHPSAAGGREGVLSFPSTCQGATVGPQLHAEASTRRHVILGCLVVSCASCWSACIACFLFECLLGMYLVMQSFRVVIVGCWPSMSYQRHVPFGALVRSGARRACAQLRWNSALHRRRRRRPGRQHAQPQLRQLMHARCAARSGARRPTAMICGWRAASATAGTMALAPVPLRTT